MNPKSEVWSSPLGNVHLEFSEAGLVALSFTEQTATVRTLHPMRDEVIDELEAYFDGSSTSFSCAIAPEGSPFEQKVWGAVRRVPFGETRSYQQIARAIGQPTAARAVGLANGRNPILLVVPCHRIIGASGRLTGYAGGLERKRKLIQHEQRVSGVVLF